MNKNEIIDRIFRILSDKKFANDVFDEANTYIEIYEEFKKNDTLKEIFYILKNDILENIQNIFDDSLNRKVGRIKKIQKELNCDVRAAISIYDETERKFTNLIEIFKS